MNKDRYICPFVGQELPWEDFPKLDKIIKDWKRDYKPSDSVRFLCPNIIEKYMPTGTIDACAPKGIR